MLKRGVFAVGVVGSVLLGGCAASTPTAETKAGQSSMADAPAADPRPNAPGMKEPTATSPAPGSTMFAEPALTTPELASDEFARAQAELDSILGTRNAKKADTELSQSGEDKPSDASSACDGACRAFASMQRAAGRLCELAGSAEPRCVSASERLGRARERVAAACPACDSARQ